MSNHISETKPNSKQEDKVKAKFRMYAESNIYLESLILAQDERWRRA